MGNLCGAFCSTATAPSASGGYKEEAFMTLILQVKVRKQGWQRSVRRLLGNIKEVKRIEIDESGKVEVSCIGNSDKVLKAIGRSGKLEHKWIQSGQCSSNLFIQESSKDDETGGKQKPPSYSYGYGDHLYPPLHPHQMITATAGSGALGYGPYNNGYGYGYGSPIQFITPYYY